MFLDPAVVIALSILVALSFYFGRCTKMVPTERIIQTEKPVDVIREVKVEVIKDKIVERKVFVDRCTADCVSVMARQLYEQTNIDDPVELDDAGDQENLLDLNQKRMTACVEMAIKAHQAILSSTPAPGDSNALSGT